MRTIPVEDASQVAEARRAAVSVAGALGFNDGAAGCVAIVATELSTNLLKHAGGGELLVGTFDDGDGEGVECIALDKGPGIANVAVAMRDGHSSAGSAGAGLGAVERQSQAMDIYSHPGTGTAVLARMERDSRQSARPVPSTGALSLAMPGEEACGDAWCLRRDVDGVTAMVVDGLGHGPLAATAAHAAVKVFDSGPAAPSAELVQSLHLALRSTRGAAASVMRLPDQGPVDFVGVGNVAGVLVAGRKTRRMVCYNGTLGHNLKIVRPFSYPVEGEAVVVLASDGLGTSWSMDSYPGLTARHPTLIAAVLYRDFSRRRDDVTVLVAKR